MTYIENEQGHLLLNSQARGAVVLNARGNAWQRVGTYWYRAYRDGEPFSDHDLSFQSPFTVLHPQRTEADTVELDPLTFAGETDVVLDRDGYAWQCAPAGGGELHWYRAGADVASRTTEKMRDLGPLTALAAKEGE